MRRLIIFLLLAAPAVAFGHSGPLGVPPQEPSSNSIEEIQSLNAVLKENTAVSSAALRSADAQSSTGDLVNLARKREELMLELAETSPSSFLEFSFSAAERNSLPAGIQQYIEKESTVNGVLESRHFDDISKTTTPNEEYFVRTSNRVELHPAGDFNAKPGDRVRVTGMQIKDSLVARSANVVVTSAAAAAPVTGSQRTAVLMAYFSDSSAQPLTAEAVRTQIFDGAVNKFYKEQSYGQMSLSGNVYGWYKINRPGLESNYCEWPTDEEMLALMLDHGLNPASYDRITVLSSHPCMRGGWAWVGKVEREFRGKTYNVSFSRVGLDNYAAQWYWWTQHPFAWTNLDYYFTHEMGHMLGVWHANYIECPPGDTEFASTGTRCQHIEYGNAYDIMGIGTYGLSVNALFKDILGWLQSRKVTVSTAGQTVTTIGPYASSSPGAKVVLVRPLNAKKPLYSIEHRTAEGFDAVLSNAELSENTEGVFINRLITDGNYASGSIFTHLIDASPSQTGEDQMRKLQRVALLPGQIFRDVGAGVEISVQASSTDEVVKVNLTQPSCVRQRPSLFSMNPWYGYAITVTPGMGVSGEVYMQNEDSAACGDSHFVATVQGLPGWKIYTPPVEGTILPGSGFMATYSVTPPASTERGEYKGTIGVKNLSNGTTVSLGDVYFTVRAKASFSPAVPDTLTPVTFNVEANDPEGVTAVDIFVDGKRIKRCTALPCASEPALYSQGLHFYRAEISRSWWHKELIPAEAELSMNVRAVASTAITAPAAGANVSGTVVVAASASSTKGSISKVEFYINDKRVGQDTSAPYEYRWNTRNETPGRYTLMSVASVSTATSSSKKISVTVLDTTLPAVSITSPAANASVRPSTNVKITANATDNVKVAKVETFVNGKLICTDKTAPYVCVWKVPAAQGNFSLQARAYDARGNAKASTVVRVSSRATRDSAFEASSDAKQDIVVPESDTREVDERLQADIEFGTVE